MANQVDPKLAEILSLLPLKDPRSLTPKRAREKLAALAAAGKKNYPLPSVEALCHLQLLKLPRERGPHLRLCYMGRDKRAGVLKPLLGLINTVLDIAKIESGPFTLTWPSMRLRA